MNSDPQEALQAKDVHRDGHSDLAELTEIELRTVSGSKDAAYYDSTSGTSKDAAY